MGFWEIISTEDLRHSYVSDIWLHCDEWLSSTILRFQMFTSTSPLNSSHARYPKPHANNTRSDRQMYNLTDMSALCEITAEF